MKVSVDAYDFMDYKSSNLSISGELAEKGVWFLDNVDFRGD